MRVRTVDPVIGFALVGWILLGLSLAYRNGHYAHGPLLGVTAALGAVALAAAGTRRPSSRNGAELLIAAALGASLATVVSYVPALYGAGDELVLARYLGAMAVAAAFGTLVGSPRTARYSVLGAGALAAAAGMLLLAASPLPRIDVWFISQQATDQLFDASPYTQCWTVNSDRDTDCLYPYLPGTFLLQLPFRFLLGDVRWAQLAALFVAAAFVYRLAHPALAPALAALVFLHPKWLFLLEQSWTEPLLLAALSATVYFGARGSRTSAFIAFGIALASKQHMLLLLPLAMRWPALGVRRSIGSVLISAAVTLPWFVASPDAFLDDALRFNLDLAPRTDSLSLYSLALENGQEPHFALVALVTLSAVAAAVLLLPRTATGFAAGSALVLLAFNVVNKQSFFNHYSLVLGLLVVAAAARSVDGAGEDPSAIGEEADHGADQDHRAEGRGVQHEHPLQVEARGESQ